MAKKEGLVQEFVTWPELVQALENPSGGFL
jgi:hypothetical protein